MSNQVNKPKQSPAGRAPISQKYSEYHINTETVSNRLTVDEALQKEFKEHGLVCRWLNSKEYVKNGNWHQSGWKAFRLRDDDAALRGAINTKYGISPEGYVVREDLILGVKSLENQAKHRKTIQQKTALQSNSQKTDAAQLRETMEKAGVKAQIHEGYDSSGNDAE